MTLSKPVSWTASYTYSIIHLTYYLPIYLEKVCIIYIFSMYEKSTPDSILPHIIMITKELYV